MNYWITVHWPPHEGQPKDDVAAGIWVPEGRQSAVTEFEAGDLVLIYHPKTGRTIVKERADGSIEQIKCQEGREGIVGIGCALASITRHNDIKPEKYIDGTELWWCWHAELKLISRSGFVPRKELCKTLGYKDSYNLRGFGDGRSGLKKIDSKVFEELCRLFLEEERKTLPVIQSHEGRSYAGGGESDAHRALKHYVAEHCSDVFGENGLKWVHTEYQFSTGDRADIVLEDKYGRIMGVEIEINVGKSDLTGTLQAIKYRWMLEVLRGCKHGDSRAALVAYTIDEEVKRISEAYNVECIEVSRSIVTNSSDKV